MDPGTHQASTPRFLVIGLDAATYDLIAPWAEKGHLPTFASLMRSSAYGPLRSVPNINSAPAWSSFATGKNPGKHGLFWFYERKVDSYELRYLSGADNPEPRFWDLWSDAGRSVVVFNVPLSYPAYPINGAMIAGMDSPSESASGFTWPEALCEEIMKAVPRYRIESDVVVLTRTGRWDQAIQELGDMVNARIELAEYLINHKPWDLFVAVFTALDRVQHTFWRHMSPAHPDYDPSLSPRYQDTILQFYQMMDDAIARLAKRCDENTYILLVSDHGMGNNQMGSFFLNPLLEEMGFFYRNERGSDWRRILRWGVRNVAPHLEGWIPRQVRKQLMSLIPGGRAAVTRELHQSGCDWSRTRVYTDYVRPELWINLKGREPQGIVEPGAEYERLRDTIIKALSQCVDIETDKPIIDRVWKREEVYWGPKLSRAPDLIIDWNYDVLVQGVRYTDPMGKTITVTEQDEIVERRDVSGDHRPDGIFLLHGPRVKPGRVCGQSLLDIAPTVLYLSGLPILDDMDGQVVTSALKDADHDAAKQRISATESLRQDRSAEALSPEDEATLEERLRALGYL